VKEYVLDQGKLWADRAYVSATVNYGTGRSRTFSAAGSVCSTWSARRKIPPRSGSGLKMFILITLAGMLLAAAAGVFIARRITLADSALIRASQQVARAV